jgi:hypothetical protein
MSVARIMTYHDIPWQPWQLNPCAVLRKGSLDLAMNVSKKLAVLDLEACWILKDLKASLPNPLMGYTY